MVNCVLSILRGGCVRPRYSITPEALEQFEAARQVKPDRGESTTAKLRRRAAAGITEFF